MEGLINELQSILNDVITEAWAAAMFYLHQFLRTIVSFLDGLIYTADAEIYDLMIDIADTEVFSSSQITVIAGRVYQLLALIMMFRLIFAFISYIVNPDQISDKKKGLGNIAKKIVITLVLIIVTPWAFMESRNVQKIVFKDRVIDYFVFGDVQDRNVTDGYYLMSTVGKVFITPYMCDGDCTAKKGGIARQSTCDENNWDTDVGLAVNEAGAIINNRGCGYGADDEPFAEALYKSTTIDNRKYHLDTLMSLPKYGKRFDGQGWDAEFYVEYRYPFIGSTLVGIFIGYMLISMCIDVAIRSIKLAFYEIISPVPIVSNIGFKEGKDSMLSKWFNDVLKTYLDLFIRIAGLKLAVLFIGMMVKEGLSDDLNSSNFMVKLFLMLGTLLFAKKLPEILKNLGINLDTGGFSLKKKLEPVTKSLASLTRPFAGAAAGAMGGMMANAQASKNVGRGLFKSTASAIGGGITGAVRGGIAGSKQKNGLGIGAGFAAAGKSGQKLVRNHGTNMFERAAAGTQQKLGLDTKADKMQKQFEYQDEWQKHRDSMLSNAKKEVAKNPSFTAKDVSYTDAHGVKQKADVNLAQATARLQAMKAQGFDGSRFENEKTRIMNSNQGVRTKEEIGRDFDNLAAGFDNSSFQKQRDEINKNYNITGLTERRAQLKTEEEKYAKNLQQQKQAYDDRVSGGFVADENERFTVRYKYGFTGSDESIEQEMSINDLQLQLSRAKEQKMSSDTINSINNAINGIRMNQYQTWQDDTVTMQKDLETAQASHDKIRVDLDKAEKDYYNTLKARDEKIHQVNQEEIAAKKAYEANRDKQLEQEMKQRRLMDEQLATIARQQEEAKAQYNEAVINLESQVNAAQNEAAYQWIEQNWDDAKVAGDRVEMNELERKMHMQISDNVDAIMNNKKAIEEDISRHEDTYRHLQKVKEASKPKNGK